MHGVGTLKLREAERLLKMPPCYAREASERFQSADRADNAVCRAEGDAGFRALFIDRVCGHPLSISPVGPIASVAGVPVLT